MHKKIKYSKRLLFSLLVSYVLVSIIPFVLIGVVWSRSDRIVMEQINETGTAMLAQIQKSVNDRVNEIDRTANQLYMNQQTQNMMYSSGDFSGENIIKAVNLIRDTSSYTSLTDSIEIAFTYIAGMDIILTDSTSAKPEMFYKVFLDPSLPYDTFHSILLRNYSLNSENGAFIRLPATDNKQYLSFWYSLPLGKGGNPLGNICILVNRDKFVSLFDTLSLGYDGMGYLVDGASGEVICSANALPWETVQTVCLQPAMSRAQIDGVEYISLKSRFSGVDRSLFLLLPTEKFLEPVNLYRRTFSFALVASMLVMAILTTYITYHTYRPLSGIAQHIEVEENKQGPVQNPLTYLEEGVKTISHQRREYQAIAERSAKIMKEYFVRRILFHPYTGDQKQFSSDCQLYQVALPDPLFCVLAVHVDSAEKYEEDLTGDSAGEVWYTIADILECIEDGEESSMIAIPNYDRNCIYLILNMQEGSEEEAQRYVKEKAQWIKDIIERDYPAVATVGIGSIEQEYRLIHQSYLNCQSALEYRLVLGVSAVISYREVPQSAGVAPFIEYSGEMENELVSGVRSGNYAKVETILNELFSVMASQQAPLMTIRCLLFDMVSTVIRIINLSDLDIQSIFDDRDPVEYLGNCETIEKSWEHFKTVYAKLCEMNQMQKRSHNNELRRQIEAFINEHYDDINLSQQMIADAFGKSANYLSFFFREQTGEKMSAYISNVRIAKALQLLRGTDLSIKDISVMTGFSSDLNFIRVFKKLQGETPGRYRKRMEEAQPGTVNMEEEKKNL